MRTPENLCKDISVMESTSTKATLDHSVFLRNHHFWRNRTNLWHVRVLEAVHTGPTYCTGCATSGNLLAMTSYSNTGDRRAKERTAKQCCDSFLQQQQQNDTL